MYFHGEDGVTLFRICRLPKPIPHPDDIRHPAGYTLGVVYDVTHMHGANWVPKEDK